MDEIDRRIVLKAGNPPLRQSDVRDTPAPPRYGSGITAEEVDRIIASFNREIK
jgi:hypothetical protein